MKVFFFKDKKRNVSYSGIMPYNDVNCLPFDFYIQSHLEITVKQFEAVLAERCPIHISEQHIRSFVQDKINNQISEILTNTASSDTIRQLLADETLSYKQQNILLKNTTLSSSDIIWLNKYAQDMGYLLDVYFEEKYPINYNEKNEPYLIYQREDGTIETVGSTEMSDGEMRALLEQRKVVQARIYHKHGHWHCFYFTFKGLAGKESGILGAKPHWHYLSDKSGILWKELINRIKSCDMPTSKVHIVINDIAPY